MPFQDTPHWQARYARRAVSYVVRYHLDGARGFKAHGHQSAEELASVLETLGAQVHIVDGDRNVHYRMYGSAGRVFDNSAAAYELAGWLDGLGFCTEVVTQ